MKRELTNKEKERFFRMVMELKSPVYFELELGIPSRELEVYKREFGIVDQKTAEMALKSLLDERTRTMTIENVQQQRRAEQIAQQRLEEMESQRAKDRAVRRQEVAAAIDGDALRRQDAERQKFFAEQQDKLRLSKQSDWRLELDGRQAFDEEIIGRFKHDILERGMGFCEEKYGVSRKDIRNEANRLKLKIDWDLVK